MSQQIEVFRTISDCPSDSARRCLELIARCAPRFLRAGGGPLESPYWERLGMNEELVARVLELRGRGLGYDRIAQEVGRSYTTVRRACIAAGEPVRTRPARITPEVTGKIRALRLDGLLVREIAEKLGLAASTVSLRVKELGLAGRRGGPRGQREAA